MILIGSRDLFYALQDIDEEFSHLFRVLVDFEYDMPAEDNNMVDFIQQVITHAKRYDFTDVDQEALRGLILQSMRDAEHQNKISAQFADILELINEASFYARSRLPCVLDAQLLSQVQAARRYRTGRVPQTLLDDIKEGQIIIQLLERPLVR